MQRILRIKQNALHDVLPNHYSQAQILKLYLCGFL